MSVRDAKERRGSIILRRNRSNRKRSCHLLQKRIIHFADDDYDVFTTLTVLILWIEMNTFKESVKFMPRIESSS